MRDGDWKLAMTYAGSRVELHNPASDRSESKDLAKSNPEVVARLTKLAHDWKATLPKSPDERCISSADRAKGK